MNFTFKPLAKTLILIVVSTVYIFAIDNLKLTTQIEYLDFSNSEQKKNGKRYIIGASGKENNHLFGVQYESTQTDTKQPPLPEDLEVDKYAFQYTYLWDNSLLIHGRYLHIKDNLAPTDEGDIFGIGVDYELNQRYKYGLRTYVSDYPDFNVYQTDLTAMTRFKYNDLSIKIQGILKGIWLDNKNVTGFTKNAQNNYLTPGVKGHFSYQDYVGGIGLFFGKRVFSVMDDGKRVQHHAMEFDRTLMLGIGKNFNNTTVMLKYNYMRATELPYENSNVTVNNTMLFLQYNF